MATVDTLSDNSNLINGLVKLTASQIEMLRLSEEDIKAGRLIPHEEVVKSDMEWLKGL